MCSLFVFFPLSKLYFLFVIDIDILILGVYVSGVSPNKMLLCSLFYFIMRGELKSYSDFFLTKCDNLGCQYVHIIYNFVSKTFFCIIKLELYNTEYFMYSINLGEIWTKIKIVFFTFQNIKLH